MDKQRFDELFPEAQSGKLPENEAREAFFSHMKQQLKPRKPWMLQEAAGNGVQNKKRSRWITVYGATAAACLILAVVLPNLPELLRMSENSSMESQIETDSLIEAVDDTAVFETGETASDVTEAVLTEAEDTSEAAFYYEEAADDSANEHSTGQEQPGKEHLEQEASGKNNSGKSNSGNEIQYVDRQETTEQKDDNTGSQKDDNKGAANSEEAEESKYEEDAADDTAAEDRPTDAGVPGIAEETDDAISDDTDKSQPEDVTDTTISGSTGDFQGTGNGDFVQTEDKIIPDSEESTIITEEATEETTIEERPADIEVPDIPEEEIDDAIPGVNDDSQPEDTTTDSTNIDGSAFHAALTDWWQKEYGTIPESGTQEAFPETGTEEVFPETEAVVLPQNRITKEAAVTGLESYPYLCYITEEGESWYQPQHMAQEHADGLEFLGGANIYRIKTTSVETENQKQQVYVYGDRNDMSKLFVRFQADGKDWYYAYGRQ